MPRKGTIIRDLSADEKQSGNYSGRELKEGDVVYSYDDATYGSIGPTGIAVSDQPNENPFYQIPKDSVTWEV